MISQQFISFCANENTKMKTKEKTRFADLIHIPFSIPKLKDSSFAIFQPDNRSPENN
jgi:hypothetical protein